MFRMCASIVFMLAIIGLGGCDDGGAAIHDGPPQVIDPQQHYVVLISNDPKQADAVASRGYPVMREAAPASEDAAAEVVGVKEHIRQLMARGLDPARITVVGAGRGGRLALEVASLMHLGEIGYVVMAACPTDGVGVDRLRQLSAVTMKGRILSLLPETGSASCKTIFDQSSGAEWWEVVLPGTDLSVFQGADPAWLDQLDDWIKEAPSS